MPTTPAAVVTRVNTLLDNWLALVPQGTQAEIDAKRAAGYYSPEPAPQEEPAAAVGRPLERY